MISRCRRPTCWGEAPRWCLMTEMKGCVNDDRAEPQNLGPLLKGDQIGVHAFWAEGSLMAACPRLQAY